MTERQTPETIRVDCVTTNERTGVQREVHRRGQTPEAIGKALAREAAERVRDDPAATEALYQAMQTASKELPDWADGETALDAKFKSVPVTPEASGEIDMKIRPASETTGWLNSEGPLDVSPSFSSQPISGETEPQWHRKDTQVLERNQSQAVYSQQVRRFDKAKDSGEAERLAAERPQVITQLLAVDDTGVMANYTRRLEADLAALRAENERLKAALQKYGRHERSCAAVSHLQAPSRWPCDCGLAAALSGARQDGGRRTACISCSGLSG